MREEPVREERRAGEEGAGVGVAGRASSRRMFAAVMAAQALSLAGQEMLQFVLPLYLLDVTGSGALFSLAIAGGFVPYLVLSPVGGVVADRTRKTGAMVAVNAVLVLTMAAFLLLMRRADAFALVLAATVASFAAQAIYQPVVQSTVPFVLAGDDVQRGVALVSQVGMVTTLGGPVAGALVYGLAGIGGTVAMSLVAFAAAGLVSAAFVRIDYEPVRVASSAWATVRGDLAEALRFLRTQRVLLGGVVLGMVVNLFGAALLNVGTAYIVTVTLSLSAVHASMAQMAIGVGGIAGSGLMAAMPDRFGLPGTPRYMLVSAVGIGALAAALAVLPAGFAFALMLGCYALCMAGFTVLSVSILSRLQLAAPPELTGKMIALFMTGANVATPVGQVVFGLCFDVCPAPAIVATTAAVLGCAALAWRRFLRGADAA